MKNLPHEIKLLLVIIFMLTNLLGANAQGDFDSNLPLILITHTGGTTPKGHQISEIKIIDVDPITQRANINDDPVYVGPMGYKIRGSSSAGFPRKQYSMETWDADMEDLDVSLLGLPEESDWVLYAPGQFDRALINNPLIYHLGNQVGVYSPRTKFAEMFINGEYRGLYVLTEKVKRGKDRTDVEKLDSSDNAEPEITGGYMLSIDRSYEGQTRWSTPTQNSLNHVYPKHDNITSQQRDYIRGYVTEFDQVLNGGNWLDPVDGYIKYVDLDSWINYHLIKNMAHEVDMLRLSTYFYKERGGKLKYGPLWDNDRALNSMDSRDDNTNTWSYYKTYGWWNKLFQDKNFETAYFDRWFYLRENQLSTPNLEILIDSLAGEVTEATTRYNYSFRYGGYSGEIAQLKVWLQARCEWLDGQFAAPPNFSQNGGVIPNGFQLTITNPNNQGTIYYTLDGTDPRLPGGAIAPNAIEYTGAVSLDNVTKVIARVQISNNNWGAKREEIFYIPQPYLNLIINELHYNPNDTIIAGDTISGKNYEFIEIRNKGNDPVNLSESSISKGIDFDFEFGTVIQPNEFIVLAEDEDRFEDRYGFPPDGVYSGKLDNNGEKIILFDPFGNIIDSVRYYNSDPWDEAPDSSGYSLELLHPSLSNDEPLNWFRSDNIGGTPKAENSRICAQPGAAIVINEINYNSNNDVLDPGNWVELHNSTDNPIDLSNWTFYDSGNKFVFASGTNIPAEGYLVLVENQVDFSNAFPNVANNKIIGNLSFGLSKKGERVSLFDQNKCLADYVIYNDKDPWPETPDGDGPSLALLDPALDNALPESWDASNDITVYFDHGSPGQSNICSPGQACDDGDPCTINDIFDAACNCAGTLVPDDADNDGVCDPADICPNFDDNLIGTPCDDGDICTEGETYDVNCGCSGGIINDIDNDGICDPLDNCDNNLEGTPCDDGDICTAGETYDENCNCTGGIFQDADSDGICDAEDICPNLENNLIGQLCDDGDPLTEFDTYNTNTCNCSGIIASAEICIKVSSSEDDAEERVDNGVVTLASGDLDMVNDEGVVFMAGMRFQNINIPQGATITNATIQFAADEVNLDQTNLVISGEAIDNAPIFEATVNNISNRSTTAANVNWQPNPWEAVGDNSANQKTIDLSPIIQEIINRPGFVQGNAISIIVEGSGIRTAESFDGSESLAPELCITYSTGLCVENYPCDDNNPATINDKFNAECECIGEDITLNAKILLEGFYDPQNNNMHTKLNDNNLLPLNQPYNVAPWNYNGNESVSSIPPNVVDWILLITRDQDGNILDQAAGFVTQSGEIMSIDGTLGIPINEGEGNRFSIHHRSHLAVLSSSNYDGEMYDFTTSENQAEGNGQLKLVDGKYMLYAGDFDGKGIINNVDFNDWKIQGAVINQYIPIDGDGNGIVNSLDYNLWTNNKSKVGHPNIRY